MKTFNRCDLVPDKDKADISMLLERAKKCGMIVKDILDIDVDGEHYKELLYTTTRWGYIKYLGIAILKREVAFNAIPGMLKLMFLG